MWTEIKAGGARPKGRTGHDIALLGAPPQPPPPLRDLLVPPLAIRIAADCPHIHLPHPISCGLDLSSPCICAVSPEADCVSRAASRTLRSVSQSDRLMEAGRSRYVFWAWLHWLPLEWLPAMSVARSSQPCSIVERQGVPPQFHCPYIYALSQSAAEERFRPHRHAALASSLAWTEGSAVMSLRLPDRS